MAYTLEHSRTPMFDALRSYQEEGTISFHVPGHKQGRGIPEFRDFVGENVLTVDATIMPDLDSICHPTGAIRAAEELAADLYGVDDAHFLVNGTTSGIQAMIMSVCQPGDKIIVPRNAHKSVIGGLILSGAAPIYIQPEISEYLGIAMGITPESVQHALEEHPDAKAVFVINSTYYGMASDLRKIVEISHSYGVPVLVDEAHGAHFHFHESLPPSAAEVGADLSALSIHKLLGSMTQSSLLVVNEGRVSSEQVKSVMNLTQTTSPSYVLLASLDVARKQAALYGREMLDRTIELATWARNKLNKVEGLYVFGPEMVGQPGCFAYDPTKLAINVRGLNISGYQADRALRREHHVQVELSDVYNLLAIGAIGDNEYTMQRLIDGVTAVAHTYAASAEHSFSVDLPDIPPLDCLPREAFYSVQDTVLLAEAVGRTSAETIMAYPPGIPIIVKGERFTTDVVDYISQLKAQNSPLQGTQDKTLSTVRVLRHDAGAKLVIAADNLLDIAG